MPYSAPWTGMTSSATSYLGQSATGTINFPNAILSTASSNQTGWAKPIHDADSVSVQADGSLLILAGILRIRVPVHLFKDLVTLAELHLVRELVGERDDESK